MVSNNESNNKINLKISRILIANNGLAAVKCIISIRQWLMQKYKNSNQIKFVCMVTDDELNAGSEYLMLADEIINVPAGKNSENFANINQILKCAIQKKVDAVYVGWGHASENPELVKALTDHKIIFIGPSEEAMSASGDKIVSTVIAQSLHIPTVNWSGSNVLIQDNFDLSNVQSIRNQATIFSVKQGLEAIQKFEINFPMMIKASEGGGGKGIRRCDNFEDFPKLFQEVSKEVPSSPIFLMNCVQNARHVEIQLIGDQLGNVAALSSRDCTIQRRCQKVIEESPASIVPEEILKNMEMDAIKFAKFVKYYSAGTVEFLYVPSTEKYFFLELNPRLQVEHPCTEIVCNLNIPSIQIQIAAGRSLNEIEDVEKYMKNPKINCHSIAARITCEDPKDRFLPSTGIAETISFNSTRNDWAYFSIGNGSELHEFADSQIGHVFAQGKTREEAIGNLQFALKNVKIRANFPTQLEYLIDLLKLDEFRNNQYDTQWLDRRILNDIQPKTTAAKIDDIVAVCGAIIGSYKIKKNMEEYLKKLKQGKIVLPLGVDRVVDVDIFLTNIKYKLKVAEMSKEHFLVRIYTKNKFQETEVRLRSIGKNELRNIAIHQSEKFEYSLENNENNYIIQLKGMKFIFGKNGNEDESILKSPYTGKLIEFKIKNGEKVNAGETFAQVESMKMIFDVVVKNVSGRLIRIAKEGDVIHSGTILAKLKVDKKDEKKLKSDSFDGFFEKWSIKQNADFQQICSNFFQARGFQDIPAGFCHKNLKSETIGANRIVILKELSNTFLSSDDFWKKLFEILQNFLELSKCFDLHQRTFDENVLLMLKKESHEEVFDKIIRNKHIGAQEELICTILNDLIDKNHRLKMFDAPNDVTQLLIELIEQKNHKRASMISAELMFIKFEKKMRKKCDPESENVIEGEGLRIWKKSSKKMEKNVASCHCVNVINAFSWRILSSQEAIYEILLNQINRSIIALQCVFNDFLSTKFVANRIDIEIEQIEQFEVSSECLEALIQDKSEALKNLEIREIIFVLKYGEEKPKVVRFVDEIGLFLLDRSSKKCEKTHRAPTEGDFKRSLARNNHTTYIYDFPLIFAKCAFDFWNVSKLENDEFDWKTLINVQELIVENNKIKVLDDVDLLRIRSREGLNEIALVAWLIKLSLTPNKSIEFVLIGNDITIEVGSFAAPEHCLFELASQFARERKLPRINISCNSGARIGIAKEILNYLKVKLKDEDRDVDYLYIDKSLKSKIGDQIVYEEIGDHLKLLAVKGKKNEHIGIENLMGSGAIGGETSRAYREIPTYCFVTGRSVGIGAYTARLARRVVQHEKAHLLLTGFNALNTLLGKKVYASNSRLGGIEVMENNGIAHSTVKSDVEGVGKLVEWLNYLPVKKSEFPFFDGFETLENVNEVNVTLEEIQKDVRFLIDQKSSGKQGIFDSDSFSEICSEWAKSIVIGRARLHQMPVGVIGSQWKSFDTKILGDEAAADDMEGNKTLTRAGQVWYPDSAFKTSQAISDFNREGLPLIIIASLRGFSGGRKDMSEMVLKFGANIIDELSDYKQAVIIYIPDGGELRGGAWAVLDSNINRDIIHMVADRNSRGGILEANAVIGIKIRESETTKVMERSGKMNGDDDEMRKIFKKAMIEYGDLHDKWQRMESIGGVEQVVELKETRKIFGKMLRNEMIKIEMAKKITKSPCHPKLSLNEALKLINKNCEKMKDLDEELEIITDYYENKFEKMLREMVDESLKRLASDIEKWKIHG